MVTLQTQIARHAPAAFSRQPRHGIMAVDGDEMVRSLLGVYFRKQGLPIWLASDGEEAVEIYEEHHGAIGLVAVDLHLPGMDARTTLAQLKEIDPGVICYFMTADWVPDGDVEVREAGAVGLVVKPFLFEFVHHIQDYLVHETAVV